MSTRIDRVRAAAAARRTLTARVSLPLLLAALFVTASARAQSNTTSTATVSSGGLCIPSGRVKPTCDKPERVVVRTTDQHTITVSLPPPESAACNATLEIEYAQWGAVAKVEGTIETPDCAACSGDYTIAVRVRSESGEVKTLQFHESWARTDDRPLKFTSEYPIGANVDLLGARASRVRCVCADAPSGAGAPAGRD